MIFFKSVNLILIQLIIKTYNNYILASTQFLFPLYQTS